MAEATVRVGPERYRSAAVASDHVTTRTEAAPAGIWSPSLLWTTLGAVALIFLAAFDELAVTTIMPTVVHDLDGADLYAAAFSSTLAAQVVGTVAGGGWSDRRGPVIPLVTAVGVFAVGLVVAATAPTMPAFILGRGLQGLGLGGTVVAIYVIVARAYPSRLHPRVFAAFAAAWVVPGLIGPAAAGGVAQAVGWPWVFLGTGALVVVALAMISPTLRRLGARSATTSRPTDAATDAVPTPPSAARPIILACLLAVAVLVVGITGDLPLAVGWIVAAVAVIATVALIRPLLPRGTLVARRGLGATILLRGTVAAAFFATEVRLPLLLQDRYGLPPWEAGLVLTVGALSWAGASALQPRLIGRVSETRALVAGSVLVTIGILVQVATVALTLPFPVVGMGWLIAAGGMGTVYPRLSTRMLGYSDSAHQGFNSSALSIVESVAGAVAIAVGGLVFVSAGGADADAAFVAAFALSAVIAAIAAPIALRVDASKRRPS